MSREIGLKKGDSGKEVNLLQSYLKKFGYIRPEKESRFGAKADRLRAIEPPRPEEFDEKTEDALKLFQAFNKIPQTGTLTRQTVHLMLTPRCGVTDIIEHGTGPEEFNLFGKKWDKTDLTYRFENFSPEMSQAATKQAVRMAFAEWSSVTTLRFSETSGQADFKIRWGAGEHGDGEPFDGPSGTATGQTLAHCFFPKTDFEGQLCFDEDEFWSSDDPPSGIDCRTVTLHEIGHGLGLRHSDNRNAIMYAYYGGIAHTLHSDDIQGIQFLYGLP
jgi:hypothetical protein